MKYENRIIELEKEVKVLMGVRKFFKNLLGEMLILIAYNVYIVSRGMQNDWLLFFFVHIIIWLAYNVGRWHIWTKL